MAWILLALGWAAPAAAQATQRSWTDSLWESLFRSENDHVRDGNDALAAGDAAGAVTDYDAAARELPSEPGVHLDRGIALLAQGDHPRAREALQLATDPPASSAIRADANYDIGLSFYQEGDAAAGADDHETAQRDFREAADAFRAALRQRPGDRDAAWNLELALRRIQQEEEAQDQQDQQDQQQQDQQDQQQQDQQDQQQQDQQDQQQQDQQDQQQQDQQDQQQQDQQDQQQQDQQDQQQQDQQDQQQQDQQDQQQQDQQDQQQQDQSSQQDRDQQQQDQQQQDQQQGSDGASQDAQQDQQPAEPDTMGTEDSLPPDERQVLDALEDGEQNFQGARARARGQRERRRVTQDW
jgi:Ca-activated chloride channel family protein